MKITSITSKQRIKQIVSIFLAAIMAAGFSSCAKTEATNNYSTNEQSVIRETVIEYDTARENDYNLNVHYKEYGTDPENFEFELPVEGSTGYAIMQLPLWPDMPLNEDCAAESAVDDSLVNSDYDNSDAMSDFITPELDGLTEEQLIDYGFGDDSGTGDIYGDIEDYEYDDAYAEYYGIDGDIYNSTIYDIGSEEFMIITTQYPGAIALLDSGTAFTVLKEVEGYWYIEIASMDGLVGWVEHRFCMINLPDVIPSIIYNATNSYSAMYKSLGREIPGVTGEILYVRSDEEIAELSEKLDQAVEAGSMTREEAALYLKEEPCVGKEYNQRLDRDEFKMPVLYSFAKKICRAQQKALADGNCIVFYEGYRPYTTQRLVVKYLNQLCQTDAEVKAAVTSKPWTMAWFINTGYSNHQMGFAMDISLAKLIEVEDVNIGDYSFVQAIQYRNYIMPTEMHELSPRAATYTSPQLTERAMTMTEKAYLLQDYCTSCGLSLLASEWWHFNDLETRASLEGNYGTGDFIITDCLSMSPADAEERLSFIENGGIE